MSVTKVNSRFPCDGELRKGSPLYSQILQLILYLS